MIVKIKTPINIDTDEPPELPDYYLDLDPARKEKAPKTRTAPSNIRTLGEVLAEIEAEKAINEILEEDKKELKLLGPPKECYVGDTATEKLGYTLIDMDDVPYNLIDKKACDFCDNKAVVRLISGINHFYYCCEDCFRLRLLSCAWCSRVFMPIAPMVPMLDYFGGKPFMHYHVCLFCYKEANLKCNKCNNNFVRVFRDEDPSQLCQRCFDFELAMKPRNT